MVDHARATTILRRFAGTLVNEYDLVDVLEQLGKDVALALGCAGAGAMLGDREGDLRFVTTSDDVLSTLEELQIELDEGPCLLAFRTGETVIAADLATDERFPAFGPRAVEAGMCAVYSFPMHLQDTTIGALNIYAEDAGDLDEDAVTLGQAMADVATIYVVHARDLEDHRELTSGLQKALDTRVVIEQAKGYLARHWETDPKQAFEVMRRHSRSNGIRVRDVAAEIVAGQLLPEDITTRR